MPICLDIIYDYFYATMAKWVVVIKTGTHCFVLPFGALQIAVVQ